jgi:hypothetical protein
MPRTTEALVGGIIELDETIPLDPFVEAANYLVTAVCAPHYVDEPTLELIERWLSAHFYAIRSPLVSQNTIDVLTEQIATYQKVDLGLDLTAYGQQAKVFDIGGYLAALDNQHKVVKAVKRKALWLGRD